MLLASTLPRNSWLLVVPLLLLAFLFAAGQLDNRAFQEDELATLVAVGGRLRVPHTLAEVQAAIAERSSEQALGWPALMSLWVRLFGWREPAVRSLSLFAGVLALAFIWRLGRDLSGHVTGLLAVLMLSTSGFFVGYMWFARSFTLVALCSTALLWCYWRIVLARRPARPAHVAGLLLASTGLLYLHYLASLFVLAVALFHVLFAWHGRHRWLPPAALGAAALAATLQLPTFLRGLDRSLHDANLKLSVLNAPEVLTAILRYLGNNTLGFPLALGWLGLALLAAIVVVQLRRRHREPPTAALLTFVFAAALLLTLVANELVRVITSSRIRYLMPLWPVMALLAGLMVWKQRFNRFRLAEWMLVAMVVTGIHAIGHPMLKYSFNYGVYRDRMHIIQRYVEASGMPQDALLASEFGDNFTWSLVREFYLEPLPLAVYFFNPADPGVWRASAREHVRFWLLRSTHDSAMSSDVADALALEAVPCGSADLKATAHLELYAWSEEDCLDV